MKRIYTLLLFLPLSLITCRNEIVDISNLYSTDELLYSSLIGTFKYDETKGEELIVIVKEHFEFEFTFKQITCESIKVIGKWAVKDSTLFFGDGTSQLFKKDCIKSNSKKKDIWKGQLRLKIVSLDDENIIVAIEYDDKVIANRKFYRSNQ